VAGCPRSRWYRLEQAIGDWLNGWEGRPSRNGPTFKVTVPKNRGSSASSGWQTAAREPLR
jgi:hypothetical protein